MNCKFRTASFWLGLGVICLCFALGIWAESANVTLPRAMPQIAAGDQGGAPIVGLWKVKFVSQNTPGIPDGAVIDEGFAAWHSDRTELMNSGTRPPPSGNFCMGVWKHAGGLTYKLNHFGLSWDPSGTVFIGPANIREVVSVDPGGNSYAGTFTIDQFDRSGNVLAHIAGEITGTRITAD